MTPRQCPMTLTAGGPCPGVLSDSGIEGMDVCSHCGTWVGKQANGHVLDVEQWVVDQLNTVGYTASTWFPGTEPPTVGGEQP